MKQTMDYEELATMKNDRVALPLFVTRRVGSEFKVYVHSHSSLSNGYVRKNALYNPQPYKGRFGVGFFVKTNNPKSTRYCYKTYYVEVKHSDICTSQDNCTTCPLYTATDAEDCHYSEE